MRNLCLALAATLAIAAPAAAQQLTVTYNGTVSGTNTTFNSDFNVPVVFTGVTTEEDGADGTLNFTSFTSNYGGEITNSDNAVGTFVGNLFRITLGGSTLADFNFVGGLPFFQTNTDYAVTLSGGQPISGFFGTAVINGGAGVVRGSTVTAAVPEPSSWAMMLIGFGAMGVAMRRRRRSDNLLQAA